LPIEVEKQDIVDYLQNNEIDLINFRSEFLDRFSFKELNRNNLDKNIDFLGLHSQIDIITFLRKIKIKQN